MTVAIRMAEKGRLPDPLVRFGIRRLVARRLADETRRFATFERAMDDWLNAMRDAPVALVPRVANEQHYEVPPEFFEHVLGSHLKYSGCHFERGAETLDEAERSMLALTCERADLRDGQRILELGCGWGSLSLWMAEHYPNARITAVSNSRPQREHIEARARERSLGNLSVVTCDMNEFSPGDRFDRVVSVEMFEHMRNWEELLRRVASWLQPGGRLFIHVFVHRRFAYPFETNDGTDWMAERFFTGGMMPSEDLIERVESPLGVEERWFVDGTHYARTAEAWLANLDAEKARVLPVLERTYGAAETETWFHRWRLFFLACAELFGFRDGTEWGVAHYRLRPAAPPELVG